MSQHHCLNCAEPIAKNFCPNCGQKTDTHRITFKHFIAHDLIHGVWHIEKGLFFTLKEAVTRPGQAALDYIRGKRIQYYNVFYLALLLLAVNAFLLHWYRNIQYAGKTVAANEINDFLSSYSKIFILSIVPLLAFNANWIFRRIRLNSAEHLIVSGMALLGLLITTAIYFASGILAEWSDVGFFGLISITILFLIPIAPLWTYLNAFGKNYSVWGISWRIFLLLCLNLVEMVLILAVVALMLSKDKISVNFVA